MTPVDHIPNNIISKLKKLLATANYAQKGDGSITESEAEIAMARAQDLLAQYNIEASTIEAAADPSLPPEEARVKFQHDRMATKEYQVRLWKSVAASNFCLHLSVPVYTEYQTPDPNGYWDYDKDEVRKIWVNRKIGTKHYVIGRETNVLATRIMGDYLEETINKLCPYRNNSNDAFSWKEGCSERIRSRLHDRMVEMQKQSGPTGSSTALTLRSVYLSEQDKNIDLEWGAGTSERLRAERAEKEALRAREEERRQMVLDNPHVFSRQEYNDAVQYVARLRKQVEKEAGQAKRESSRYWSGKNLGAWMEGRKAGDKVGLEPQVAESSKRRLK